MHTGLSVDHHSSEFKTPKRVAAVSYPFLPEENRTRRNQLDNRRNYEPNRQYNRSREQDATEIQNSLPKRNASHSLSDAQSPRLKCRQLIHFELEPECLQTLIGANSRIDPEN